MLTLACLGLALCFLMMLVVWLFQLKTLDATIVDVFWPLSISATVCLFAGYGTGAVQNRMLVAGFGLVWGGRLALYAGTRAYFEVSEDHRFAAMRKQWGTAQHRRFLPFFLAQGFCAWLLALSFLPIAFYEQAIHLLWVQVAVGVAVVAIIMETIADVHLLIFRQSKGNVNKTLRSGLWRYSRHPNYFFEWIFWLAVGGLGIASCFSWSGDTSLNGSFNWIGGYGWMAISSPILMLLFLTKMTGIPTTEAHCVKSRIDYGIYQQQVPAFLPRFFDEKTTEEIQPYPVNSDDPKGGAH